MGALGDRIAARIGELERHLDEIQTRADVERQQVQIQISALQSAHKVLTPEVEQTFGALLALKLLPKDA